MKVQKAGGEQPLREPPVDAKAYQQMVKYYYKKVDENKEFEGRSIETHYEKIEGPSMKEKLHLGSEQVKYKMFGWFLRLHILLILHTKNIFLLMLGGLFKYQDKFQSVSDKVKVFAMFSPNFIL